MFWVFGQNPKRKEINQHFRESLLADMNVTLAHSRQKMLKFRYGKVFLWALRNRGTLAVFIYRLMRRSYKKSHKIRVFILSMLNQVLCGVEIGYSADIGPGFEIAHGGCIVISGKVVAGKNLSIRQGVTIGGNLGKRDAEGRMFPILGNEVLMGAAACILGPVKIGSNVLIGAHSVVTNDVPDNAVVTGYPATVVQVDGKRIPIQERGSSLGRYLKEIDERLTKFETELKLFKKHHLQDEK
jgi:serine O-acetyltransferase